MEKEEINQQPNSNDGCNKRCKTDKPGTGSLGGGFFSQQLGNNTRNDNYDMMYTP